MEAHIKFRTMGYEGIGLASKNGFINEILVPQEFRYRGNKHDMEVEPEENKM